MKLSALFLLFLAGILLLITIVAIVSAQNPTPIVLQFLTWRSVSLPLGLVLIFSLLLGMITGATFWFLGRNNN